MTKVKQVFIHETMAWGGAEVLRKTFACFVQNHADWQSKFEVIIVCLTKKGPVAELLEGQGVRVIALNWQASLPSWKLLFKLRRVLCELQPDVVHTCLFEALRHGVLAARLAGCQKVIIEEHGDNCWMGWRERWASRALALLASKVIAVSNAQADHLMAFMPYPACKLAVLPNCIDVEALTHNQRDEQVEVLELVAVGSLREIKNIPLLLKAFALVLESWPACRLSIVGEGDLKSSLISLSAELGLSEKVYFLGTREDVGVILNGSDIYVHAGHSESFCIAMAEAMYSGCACVAPDCAVFRWLSDDGRVALLVELDNAAAMASGILSLLQDTTKRRALGLEASEYASEAFHPEKYIVGLLNVYRTIGVL